MAMYNRGLIKPALLLILVALLWFAFSGCIAKSKYVKEGRQLESSKEWDKCVRVLQKAEKEYPEDTEIRLMLTRAKWNASVGHMAKGEALLDKRLYQQALSEFELAVIFNPGNSKAASLLDITKNKLKSKSYEEQGKRFLEARKNIQSEEALKKAAELDPQNLEARKLLEIVKDQKESPKKYRLKVKSNAPISLKFKKTPILNVFEVLTKIAEVNFIFDKDMKESKVTLFMTDVSFDQFLDVLLRTNKLAGKLVDEKTMIIYPLTPAKAKEYEDLQIRTFYLSNLDVKKAVGLLAKILKSKDIIANEKMNAIVIRGPKDVLEIASRIIAANDRTPSEVLLNVELLQVKRKKQLQLGLEFNPTSVTFGVGESSKVISANTTFVDTISLASKIKRSNVLVSLPTATLNLLKQDGDTRILANPQLRVKNNEKALIHIGDRVPLRVNRRIDTDGNVTNDYQYQDVGVKLDAEPTINLNGEVTISLSLEVSAIGENVGTIDDPQFTISTRTTKSVLILRDGEPVIIGGLIREDERETIRKVPLIGDIPILGWLFTSLDTEKDETEIIMSITPVITRVQEIPGPEVTHIWSGKERSFSITKPYEGYTEEKGELTEPKQESQTPPVATSPKRMLPPGFPKKGMPALPGRFRQKAPGFPPSMPFPPKQTKQPPLPPKSEIKSPNVATAESRKIKPSKGVSEIKKQEEEAVKKIVSADVPGIQESFWPSSQSFSIHVNSFPEISQAEERVQELVRMKYDCFIVPSYVPGLGFFYRVYLGKFEDQIAAENLCKILKQKKVFQNDIHVITRRWAL